MIHLGQHRQLSGVTTNHWTFRPAMYHKIEIFLEKRGEKGATLAEICTPLSPNKRHETIARWRVIANSWMGKNGSAVPWICYGLSAHKSTSLQDIQTCTPNRAHCSPNDIHTERSRVVPSLWKVSQTLHNVNTPMLEQRDFLGYKMKPKQTSHIFGTRALNKVI